MEQSTEDTPTWVSHGYMLISHSEIRFPPSTQGCGTALLYEKAVTQPLIALIYYCCTSSFKTSRPNLGARLLNML